MRIRTFVIGTLLLLAGVGVGVLLAGQLYKSEDLPAPAAASSALQSAIVMPENLMLRRVSYSCPKA